MDLKKSQGGSKPLEGLTVVEIGHSVAAPYAGLVLSDLGAEVIKVENPKAGDTARGWGPPFWDNDASLFHALNRGKKGLAVDLGDSQQASALKRLILGRADVVIQNLRAGAVDAYGLGAEALRREKPELIYCDLSAFGGGGPLADKPGYDPLMQAFGGLMSVTGEGRGRPPVRVGVSIVDMGAGMWAVIGILASLFERASSKRGSIVQTSLFETALAWMAVPMAAYQASGELRPPYGSGTAEIVPYQCFMTRDGWLMIAVGSDGLFSKFSAALGCPDWAADPRFATNGNRVANRDVLLPMIEDIVRHQPLTDLMERLDAVGVPNAPLQTIDQVAAHPQTQELGIVQTGPKKALPLMGLPLSFDGTRPALKWPTPALGEHNSQFLKKDD
ncbi:MAG: CoA transferase [Bradyrhizobium sp.]|uniref:CaiB/BaiF CoA transferase family protein n=1 Tax=Bradyrhizobium sp. TaxID=376 RepID=UPI0011F7E865|nr:CoA transferase [Bradyrhizobium sp.]THD68516.1 MAG: CoA transferase [Bradyrhizobium sp.]